MIPSYFDYAATTPLDPRVHRAMAPFLRSTFGNPSSIHSFGRDAQAGIDHAREQVSAALGAQRQEIIFTSGATEANNLAIQGVLKQYVGKQPIRIITTPVEHPSVKEVFRWYESQGVDVVWLAVDKSGAVSVEEVVNAVNEQTVLVSIMMVNNELGTVQPIAQIGTALASVKKNRTTLPLYFHTDAVQACAYMPCLVNELGVDLMTVSAHKCFGPKGVGVLYVREGVALEPVLYGGHQEYARRPGTPSPALIVGCGEAIALAVQEREARVAAVRATGSQLHDALRGFDSWEVNTAIGSAPHILNGSFVGRNGAQLVMALDLAGVAVSSGAACAAGAVDLSPVLQACGLSKERVVGAVRFSWGPQTTERDVRRLVTALRKIMKN